MTEKIVDKDKRLSQSLLWDLQREAYCQFGIGAWSRKGVPSYITSNAYTAKCYAHVVLGYLRDGVSQNLFDYGHPIYFFDLGAGTGRFAYLFLKELFRLIGTGPLSKIKICYVMTDIAADNIDFWQKHPYLHPYYEKGILDCAPFHHAQDLPIHLIRQNKSLSTENIVNPIIVIANYFFDTIPQDLFRVNQGVLEEGRITLSIPENITLESKDPDVINHLKFQYSYYPVNGSSYYQDNDDNAVLDMYRNQFDGNTFLFPAGAFQVLRTFRDLSKSRMLLLAGDQGVCTQKQVQRWGNPTVALHGSFSIAVSYHAIEAYINRFQGKPLMTTFSDSAFVVMGALLNQGKMDHFYETEMAFREHIDSFEPTDYWRFITMAEKEWKTPSLNYILLLIKLGNWDVMCLHAFFPLIREQLPHAIESQKERLAETIHCVWENYYPVAREEGSFIASVGTLLYEMGFHEQASMFFYRADQISKL